MSGTAMLENKKARPDSWKRSVVHALLKNREKAVWGGGCWKPFFQGGSMPGSGIFPNQGGAGIAPLEPPADEEPTPTPPPPPITGFRDTLTDPGFDVPFTTTTNVSGGGTALQTAITAAGPSTRLLITDSATYDPVIIDAKTNLTIEGQSGQTPILRRVAPGAFPGTVPGWTIRLSGVIDGVKIKNVRFEGHGNQDSLSFANNGMINCRPDAFPAAQSITTLNHLIVEDCTFQEMTDSPLNGNCAVMLFTGSAGLTSSNIVVRRCIMDTNGAGAWVTAAGVGVVTISGFGNVFIQNDWIRRTTSLVARASSNARGVVVKNLSTIVEDVLVDDLGTAGSNENFNHVSTAGAQFGSAVGVTSCRNCVAYNAKRGYRMQLVAATFTCTNCVYHTDVVGILAGNVAVRETAGSMIFRDSVMVGAGDGTAFEAAVSEDHNDVFNFGALGKVLDATDLTVDPLFQDVPNNLWVATEPSVMTGATDTGAMGVRYPGGELIIWILTT